MPKMQEERRGTRVPSPLTCFN